MEYHDGRFAKDARFRFFAMNTILRHDTITKSNLYMKSLNDKKCTMQQLRQMIINDKSILSKINVYCSSMRSSKGYWLKRYIELKNMVKQNGIPTKFFILSAADYHWPDLFRLLCPDKKYEELSDNEKRNLMHDNPITVFCIFFSTTHGAVERF